MVDVPARSAPRAASTVRALVLRHPCRARPRGDRRGHPPGGRGRGDRRAGRARLRGRPRRSGVHRVEQRLARRRPRPRRRARRQARRAGRGRALAAARSAALVAVVLRGRPLAAARRRCPGLLLLVLVASGWAYNAGLKRTAMSVVPYVTGFGALPAGVVAAAPGHTRGPVVAGHRGRRARGRGAPGQRGAGHRGRPRHRRARAAAPARRGAVGRHRRPAAGRRLPGAGAGPGRPADAAVWDRRPRRRRPRRRRGRPGRQPPVPPAGLPGGHAADRARRRSCCSPVARRSPDYGGSVPRRRSCSTTASRSSSRSSPLQRLRACRWLPASRSRLRSQEGPVAGGVRAGVVAEPLPRVVRGSRRSSRSSG